LFELLSKCASHPSVAICGMVLPVVTPLLRTEVGIATQWLPTLQRRAIIPHHPPPSPSSLTHTHTHTHNNNSMNTTNALLQLMRDRATKDSTTIAATNGYNNHNNDNDDDDAVLLLSASEICCVEFEEFVEQFRETVLKEALRACYGIHADYYLASCTAAIEEFCVGEMSATKQTSFHLEAALFCVVAVAEDVVPSLLSTPTTTTSSSTHTTVPGDSTTNSNIVKDATAANYLVRCTVALAKKPKSLNNPLTMVQTCRFIRKFAKWFGADQQHPGLLEIAADLTLFVFSQCSTSFPDTVLSRNIHRESAVVPYAQAAKTLRYLLIHNPHYFLSNRAIAALGAGWEATFAASNRSGRKLLTLQDRKDTCTGICHVLASLPQDQQQTSLMALALASIACLEAMVKRAVAVTYCTTTTSSLAAILERAADEIVILATTARAFTDASTTRTTMGVGSSSESHSSCVSSSRASIVMPAMTVLRRAWPTISMAASKFSFNDSILDSLGILFVECMPSNCNTDVSLCFLQDICTLSTTVIESEEAHRNDRFFSPVLTFMEQSVEVYGTTIDNVSLTRAHDGSNNDTHPDPGNDKEMYKCLDSLMRLTMTTMINQQMLGSVWNSIQKQGNGQAAFETKTKRGTHNNSDVESNVCSTTGLAPLFSLLSKCVTRCPLLLLHILAGGPDEGTTEYSINDDKTSSPDLSMLREVMDAAVSSILYPQLEISIQAIKFLEAIVLLTHHHHQSTTDLPMKSDRRNWSDEYQVRCKTKNVLCTVLRGMCGIFQPAVIPDACRLLFHTLSSSLSSASVSASAASTVPTEEEELQTLLLRGLSPEHFFLGDRAWRVIYDFCLPCNTKTIHEMEHIMTDMWQLHRFDNVEAIARSDVVHLFCLQYSQKKKKNVNVDLTPNSLGYSVPSLT